MLQQIEHLYCSQQIDIPPRFPQLLKNYAKDAIRTQPGDLLLWSACYFRCLAQGIPTPAKKRIEVPSTVQHTGLTPGFIAVLIKQFGHVSKIDRDVLWKRWIGVCLCDEELNKMLTLGKMLEGPKIPWIKFVALMIGHLCNSLTETMIMFCEIMTNEPDGGSAMIPFPEFKEAYSFLAQLDCGSTQMFKDGRKVLDKRRRSETGIDYYKSETETNKSSPASSKVGSPPSGQKESMREADSKPFYVGTNIESEVTSKYGAAKRDEIVIDSVIDKLIGDEATDEFDLDKLGLHRKKPDSVSLLSEQASSVDIFPIHPDALLKSAIVYEDGAYEDEEDFEGIEQCEDDPLRDDKSRQDGDLIDLDDNDSINTFSQVFDMNKSTQLTHTTVDSNMTSRNTSNTSTVENLILGESDEEGIVSYAEPAEYWHEKEAKEKAPCRVKPGNMDHKKDDVIYIDPIKGIGPTVPIPIVEAFLQYMQCCSKMQHNMVMPRNMRNYICPILEPNCSKFESKMINIDIIY